MRCTFDDLLLVVLDLCVFFLSGCLLFDQFSSNPTSLCSSLLPYSLFLLFQMLELNDCFVVMMKFCRGHDVFSNCKE